MARQDFATQPSPILRWLPWPSTSTQTTSTLMDAAGNPLTTVKDAPDRSRDLWQPDKLRIKAPVHRIQAIAEKRGLAAADLARLAGGIDRGQSDPPVAAIRRRSLALDQDAVGPAYSRLDHAVPEQPP